MKNILTGPRQACCTLVSMLAVLPMLAGAMSTVTVKVTVVAPPPCVINDNRPIEVEFGNVMTTRVDGNNYNVPVNYTLSCNASNALKLQVRGTGATFDVSVLRTNQAGLGIELRQGGNKLAVNSWLNFAYPNKPELRVVPVKQSGVTLKGGEFSAGATMAVDYQ